MGWEKRLPVVGGDRNAWGPVLNDVLAEIRDRVASLDREVRSDVEGLYAYMGVAAPGTTESATGWSVTRITISDAATATASGAWSDRLTLTYA